MSGVSLSLPSSPYTHEAPTGSLTPYQIERALALLSLSVHL